MKNISFFLLSSLCSLTALAGDSAPAGNRQPLHTIPVLDVPRYMGTWYEIAKYPNWFQKKCAGWTRAEYSLQRDGTVQVINRCRLENGEIQSALGTARQAGPATSPKLEVRFAPAWLSFLPFVWGDYWIIDLDEHYQLVAVSEPEKEYLWILARTPVIAADDYRNLLTRLSHQGFDIRRLEVTRQD
ncbi:lipocalin family protein [Pseudomonas sp. AN-1]|uniref:lipocalin family protein n=1 Tax=Pseudomonas sp. AN-1 TaxID=3096605 RepID=UPI002A6A853C|nr:lipocalin family protein [Pseudomonas sp. AN-1]WPP46747.1 lipocalin family protein [Pseudomonas sp. AN-1]